MDEVLADSLLSTTDVVGDSRIPADRYIGLACPPSVPPFLARLLPVGFSVPSVHGVQVPLLPTAVV